MIKWLEKHPKLSWTLTIGIAVSIFYISSLTFQHSPSSGLGINTILYHIMAFFAFSFSLAISILKGKNVRYIFIAANVAIIYAFSDELHQLLVPGRNSSLQDVFFDSIGILFASILYVIIVKIRKK
jgi:VanZ family protein